MAINLSAPPDTGQPPEGVLTSTKVSESVKITSRAIIDVNQAWRVYSKIKQDNIIRNENDAIIFDKYSDGQPFDPIALANSGQGNRYNFPTGFMPSIVDRVTPVPISIIDSARYLTSASLSNINYNTRQIDPEKGKKTEQLREKVTKAIRRWPDWKTFCTGLCQELVLIGRAFALKLDPFTPWPRFFKTDQAFLPNGTGEHARNIQIIVADQDFLPHELVNFIKDKEAAKSAGWDIENCVMAINESLPKQINDDGTYAQNKRSYEDAIREGNVGQSYSGNTVILVAHVLAVEANDVPGEDNKVTHYIVYRKGNHEVLFKKEDRFKKIEDCVTLFTLEPGNGKFYGSKGLGRKLINAHLAIERARNRMFDQLEMSGLVILKTDASKAPTVQFKVRHPFILTTTDAEFQEQVIQANAKSYIDADTLMRDLVQQRVGQYLPNAIVSDQGSREKTAREVSVDYQREAEAKVAFLSRFWGQFADLISSIQRGLLDPQTTDKIAKELQQELKESGITEEEMREFANAPAAEVIQDLTQIQNQQIMAVAAKYGQNPAINQRELMIRDIVSMSSPAIAEAVVLPEQGMETLTVEAVRQQMIETEAMLQGAPGMPVSPRDRHEDHLKVLLPDMNQGISKAEQSGGAHPLDLGKLAAGLTHAQGHTQQWMSSGGDPKVIKGYEKAVLDLDNRLKKITIATAKGIHEQQQAQQQQSQDQQDQQVQAAKESISINYADAPESIKRQMEQRAGFTPAPPEEAAAAAVQESILKHPTLPEHISKTVIGQNANTANQQQAVPATQPIPTQGIPQPVTTTDTEPNTV